MPILRLRISKCNMMKTRINGKNIIIINNIFYADTDLEITNKELLQELSFYRDKLAYIDFNIEKDSYKIVKGVVCKTKLHVYLCNIVVELKEQVNNIQEFYNKVLEEVAKVIT